MFSVSGHRPSEGCAIAPAPRLFAGIWGDGIVDDGIEFALSNPHWHDVDDDELIFYAATLLEPKHRHERVSRLRIQLRSALACRVWCCAQALTGFFPGAETRDELLMEIDRLGVLGTARATTLFDEGAREITRWLGETHFIGLRRPSQKPWWATRRNVDHSVRAASKAHELKILGLLSQCLRDIEAPDTIDHRDISARDLGLISIHSGVNACYIYPRGRDIRDAMIVAGWIGFLLRGRSALLSPSIAGELVQILETASSADSSDRGSLGAMIAFHAEIVFGSRMLSRIARECVSARCVAHVSPRLRNPVTILARCAAFSRQRFDLDSKVVSHAT